MKAAALFCCVFTTLGMLVGCSNIPTSGLRGYSSQPMVLSADHWGGLAQDSAREVLEAFAKLSREKGTRAPTGVFVPEMPQDSAFYRAYSSQLKQALLRQGLTVHNTASNSLVINFKAETYLYSRRTGGRIPFTNNTMFAVLAVWAPEWLEFSPQELRTGIISLTAIFDVLRAKAQVTDAEAMLITTIEDGETVVLMSNQPFYIEPRDLLLYWTDQPAMAVMRSGVDRSKSPPLKNIQVVQ